MVEKNQGDPIDFLHGQNLALAELLAFLFSRRQDTSNEGLLYLSRAETRFRSIDVVTEAHLRGFNSIKKIVETHLKPPGGDVAYAVDENRRELLIKHRDLILGNSEKTYIITPFSEIEHVLTRGKDDRFTVEQMLRGLKGFLGREKGITRMEGGFYEITKELKLSPNPMEVNHE